MELERDEMKEKKVVATSLFLEKEGQLFLRRGSKEVSVEIKASFPWTSPESHLSVLDAEGEVLMVIEDLASLDIKDAALIRKKLDQTSFMFEVEKVIEIRNEFELRHWSVETQNGPRSFQTGLEDWPRELPDGSYLVTDVSGDLYRVREQAIEKKKFAALFK